MVPFFFTTGTEQAVELALVNVTCLIRPSPATVDCKEPWRTGSTCRLQEACRLNLGANHVPVYIPPHERQSPLHLVPKKFYYLLAAHLHLETKMLVKVFDANGAQAINRALLE